MMTKDLIPQNQFGVFAIKKESNGVPVVESRLVAKLFDKRHSDVLRDVRNIISEIKDVDPDFTERNFALSGYKDKTGRNLSQYLIAKDGFTFLTMGYHGSKATKFKLAYIHHYDEMELQIKDLLHARVEFPKVTELLSQLNPGGSKYQYSNEANLINKVALGLNAKQFREANEIPSGESIRPYLSKEQINLVDLIQSYDQILLINRKDYQSRKELLIAYKVNMQSSPNIYHKLISKE